MSGATGNDRTTIPLVQAANLSRRAPAGATWMLDEVSLQIHEGERIALHGPAGAGKTLLLRALAVLDPIDNGKVLWRGEPVTGARVPLFRSQVCYLHQQPAVFSGTVEDSLRLPFVLQVHSGKSFNRERIERLLQMAGQNLSFLQLPLQTLSGGERQIAALLRVLQLDPTILLLDEPTSSLDPGNIERIEELVNFWMNERPSERALVWVSHDAAQRERMTTRSLVMKNGRIVDGED